MDTCFERFKLGFILGGTVGAAMGCLLGSYSVFRYGHGGDGFIRTVGKSALQSGAMFGLFMGIGGLIRCDPPSPSTLSLIENLSNDQSGIVSSISLNNGSRCTLTGNCQSMANTTEQTSSTQTQSPYKSYRSYPLHLYQCQIARKY